MENDLFAIIAKHYDHWTEEKINHMVGRAEKRQIAPDIVVHYWKCPRNDCHVCPALPLHLQMKIERIMEDPHAYNAAAALQ